MPHGLATWRVPALAGATLCVSGVIVGHGTGDALALSGLFWLVLSTVWHLESQIEVRRRV